MGEWQPGDVAVSHAGGPPFRLMYVGSGWVNQLGSVQRLPDNARPLVMIDPEDHEQVERLAVAWGMVATAEFDGVPITLAGARMREALRSLITPPKPDEPQGLGAVVEDDAGRIYTRYETAEEPQPWWQSAHGPEHDVVRRFSWDDVAAVRVLSEGVTA